MRIQSDTYNCFIGSNLPENVKPTVFSMLFDRPVAFIPVFSHFSTIFTAPTLAFNVTATLASAFLSFTLRVSIFPLSFTLSFLSFTLS